MTRDEIAQAMQDTAGNSWGDEAHFQRFAALVIKPWAKQLEVERKRFQELNDIVAVGMQHAKAGELRAMKDAFWKQPEEEPVAWVCEGSTSDEKHAIDYWPGDVDDIPVGTMLYTAPPQRKPLTPQSPCEMTQAEGKMFKLGWLECEAAHGIKGQA